jgi:hypothetical protein
LPIEIKTTFGADNEMIDIGSYRFTRATFYELLKYVWRVGYPRWKDEIRPGYVSAMRDKLLRNCQGIFEGIAIE